MVSLLPDLKSNGVQLLDQIPATEMSLLHRGARLSPRDRARSSDIQDRFKVESLLLHIEWSQLRWFERLTQDASWRALWGGVPGMSIWEETPGQTQDMLELLSTLTKRFA